MSVVVGCGRARGCLQPLHDIDGSLTIELLVRNGEELTGPAGRSLPLLTIQNADESTAVALVIRNDDREVPDGHVREFLAGQPRSLFNAPATTLRLPIADAPSIPLGTDDVRWANVLHFAKTPQPDDWAPILQAAFASGAEGVLFPANEGGGYRVRTTVEVPAHVRYLLGMRTSVGRHDDLQGPTLRIAQESEHPVIFERLGVAGTLEHPGKRVAVKCYRRAAEQGLAEAQFSLGLMYYTGEGVPLDYVQAYKWFTAATHGGFAEAEEIQHGLASKMSGAQIAEALRLSREFRLKKTTP